MSQSSFSHQLIERLLTYAQNPSYTKGREETFKQAKDFLAGRKTFPAFPAPVDKQAFNQAMAQLMQAHAQKAANTQLNAQLDQIAAASIFGTPYTKGKTIEVKQCDDPAPAASKEPEPTNNHLFKDT